MFKLISDIKIRNRIRKEFGNIEGLANTMKEPIGLINPITIDENNNLMAGHRRILAAKLLGWTKIECIVKPAKNRLLIEMYENAQRKGWTCDEYVVIREKVEKAKQKEWEERKNLPKEDKTEPIFVGKKMVHIISELTGDGQTNIRKKLQIADAAKADPEKYNKVKEAVDKGTKSTTTAMKQIDQYDRNVAKAAEIPEGKWGVISVDVPVGDWDNKTVNGAADNNYSTWTKEQSMAGIIEGKDVRDLFADDCIGYFYFPASRVMTDAADIIRAWGFEPTTNFIWDKLEIKTGFRQRNQHEHCCIGIKGNVPLPAIIHNSIHAEHPPSRIHSKKPYGVYKRIMEEYPNRKYLEIFGKERYSKDWTVIGNEYNPNDPTIVDRKKSESVEKVIKEFKKILRKNGLEINWPKIAISASEEMDELSMDDQFDSVAKDTVLQILKTKGIELTV